MALRRVCERDWTSGIGPAVGECRCKDQTRIPGTNFCPVCGHSRASLKPPKWQGATTACSPWRGRAVVPNHSASGFPQECGSRLKQRDHGLRMNELGTRESDSRPIIAIISFSRDVSVSKHGAKSTTTVSFTRRTEGQDYGVHETELRRSGFSGDVNGA